MTKTSRTPRKSASATVNRRGTTLEMIRLCCPDASQATQIAETFGLAILDSELASREFAAGDTFSIADITGMIAIDFMKPARVQRPEGLANVERWYKEVAARPSAKA